MDCSITKFLNEKQRAIRDESEKRVDSEKQRGVALNNPLNPPLNSDNADTDIC